jgi:hypothetical protein
LQLVAMQASQALEAFVALRGQVHLDQPPVAAARLAPHPAGGLAAGHQRHDAMVLGLQPLGELRHRGPVAPGEATDLQHQGVLQRRDAVAVRHVLAEAQEAAQGIAKARERFEIGFGEAAWHGWAIYHAVMYQGQDIEDAATEP